MVVMQANVGDVLYFAVEEVVPGTIAADNDSSVLISKLTN